MNKLISIIAVIWSLLIPGSIFAQYKAALQASSENKALKDYFAKNNIQPTKTPSGLYYVITKPGTGENAKPGQQVHINYVGKLLNGKKFDANVDEHFENVHPFSFTLGTGQVIQGWDEGIRYFNEGAHGWLYIPSSLGYGDRAMGSVIPANSALVFEIEVTDIEN